MPTEIDILQALDKHTTFLLQYTNKTRVKIETSSDIRRKRDIGQTRFSNQVLKNVFFKFFNKNFFAVLNFLADL